MPEKQTRSEPDPRAAEQAQPRQAQGGAPASGRRVDSRNARRDPGKLRENQARLGVGPEHKTDAMKKGHRGTYP